MNRALALTALLALLSSPLPACDEARLDESMVKCFARPRIDPYAELGSRHRLTGLASYYSAFFDGRKTANGEIYRNARFSAAHLTLPLGCWIEVRARTTGRMIRLRVNDRGPFVKKFVLDLSRSAAQALGVDVAEDRYVEIRVVGLPGEDPLGSGTGSGPN